MKSFLTQTLIAVAVGSLFVLLSAVTIFMLAAFFFATLI